MLSTDQISEFRTNGFLTIEDYLSGKEIAQIKAGGQQIVADFDMEEVRIFTTENQSKHMDRYFLGSGDKVRCFFEEGAFDLNGKLTVEKALAINKIGHAMHDLLPEFERISYKKNLYDLAILLGLQVPSIVQSQYIFKQPHIGGEVHAHTDSTFINTTPLSCLGAWIALEDATIQNGCLLMLPGSQRHPLQNIFVRNTKGTGTEFVDTNHERVEWDIEKLAPVEVKKGSLVLIDGKVVHASLPNRSTDSRHAYVLHLVDLDSEWSTQNWLQRSKHMPFRRMENVVN